MANYLLVALFVIVIALALFTFGSNFYVFGFWGGLGVSVGAMALFFVAYAITEYLAL